MPTAKKHIKSLAGGYSSVVFSSSPIAGAALFLTTLLNPNVAIAGLIAVAASRLFARLINFDESYLDCGHYTFNPLLAGMAVGFVFRIAPVSALLIGLAGILAFAITIVSSGSLSCYMKLPVLSLPFSIAALIVYIAAVKYPGFTPHGFYPHWAASSAPALPLWIEGFFRSFGMLFFLPYILPGIIVAAVVFCSSRILFTCAALGYFSGVATAGALSGSIAAALADPYNFNYIIIAMALGAVFAIPSLTSYLIAIVSACAAAVCQNSLTALLSRIGVPVFALPFNLVTMLFLYALGSAYYKGLTKRFMPTPEETLDYYLSVSRRFKSAERSMHLPVAGTWTVWQGFNGEWTHKAERRFAYDFIIAGENGKSFQNGGGEVSDYHAFGKPVLSPARGRVVKVISGLADNPIGQVDKGNIWGNFVIIYDERGFYIAIAHLMKDSIAVMEGAWLERGAFIGKCGNSGYSPQPHIHIQAQEADKMSSATLPFTFICYTTGVQFNASGLPPAGSQVEPLFEDKAIAAKTAFMLGDKFHYEVFTKGKKTGMLDLEVKSAADGTFYFDSGAGRLYFGKYEGSFYAYRAEGNDSRLKAMFLALPCLPPGWKNGLKWNDFVPANMAYSGLASSLLMFASSFWHGLARIDAEMRYTDQDTIEGKVFTGAFGFRKITGVALDEESGFKTVRAGEIELRRLNNGKVRG